MINFLGFVIKGTLFALGVIVLAETLKYDGKSVSDQIYSQVGALQQSGAYKNVEGWVTESIQTQVGAQARRISPVIENKKTSDFIDPQDQKNLKILIQSIDK